jgi:hypothetical protein
MFPIYDVTSSAAERPETLGSKEKFWLTPAPTVGLTRRPHLFKIGRIGTGENWSEKASCELAKLIGLPCAEYHFAVCDGAQGVLSETMYPKGGAFIPANLIISRIDPQYDGSLRFGQVGHKLVIAMNLVSRPALRPPMGFEQIEPTLDARDCFVGYLLFDTFIGNTDRHHENWGIVVAPYEGRNALHLAESFDHASSLGRELTDAGRQKRLTTKDLRANLAAYATRARSAFYGVGTNPPQLTTLQVAKSLAQSYPDAFNFWAERIAGVDKDLARNIFNRIDRTLISEPAIEFAISLLMYNQGKILEIADGS